MKELLEKINEYALANGEHTLSLAIESDESGFLISNIYEIDKVEPFFEFESLSELYEEIGIE